MAHFRPTSRTDKFKYRAHATHGEQQILTFYRTIHAALTNSRAAALFAFATCVIGFYAFDDPRVKLKVEQVKVQGRLLFDRLLLPAHLRQSSNANDDGSPRQPHHISVSDRPSGPSEKPTTLSGDTAAGQPKLR